MQSIEERVERLERSAGRWRAACLLTIGAAGFGVCMAAIAPATRPGAAPPVAAAVAEPPGNGVIRGRSIELRDGDDSPTVHIYAFKSEAGIMVQSAKPEGQSLVWLAASEKDAGAGVSRHVTATGVNNRITFAATEKGQSVSVSDKAGPREIRPTGPRGENP